MKYKVSDIKKLKRALLEQAIADTELEVQRLLNQSESDGTDSELFGNSTIQTLSDLKTPIAELRQLLEKPVAEQKEDLVGVGTLFDLSISSAGKTKVTTFFILPISSLGKMRPNVKVEDISVTLATKTHPWFGRKLNERIKVTSKELWDEPHMGHVIPTGKFSDAGTLWVSWIYK